MLTTAEIDRLLEENEYPRYDGLAIIRFAHAVEREAYKRAAQECRVTCGKNHADAAAFKSGTKAYVQGCDDCDAAIEALGREE